MKTSLILEAIDALNMAREALNTGLASVEKQMAIARLCALASARMEQALTTEHPNITLVKEEA